MSVYLSKDYKTVIDTLDEEKMDLILSSIPNDTKTIIDIGCGNGMITNRLGKHFEVTGVDINPHKIKYVETKKILSSSHQIDLPDQSFDMAFSSELLEHLDPNLFDATLREMERLATKYLLITVPFKESLWKLVVKCEKCKKRYHKNGHLQNFDENKVRSLFLDFEMLQSQIFGRKVRVYNKFLATLKHQLAPPSSWIPRHWLSGRNINFHYCIHCSHKNFIQAKFHPVSFFCDSINTFVSVKQPFQLMALYRKRDFS